MTVVWSRVLVNTSTCGQECRVTYIQQARCLAWVIHRTTSSIMSSSWPPR